MTGGFTFIFVVVFGIPIGFLGGVLGTLQIFPLTDSFILRSSLDLA